MDGTCSCQPQAFCELGAVMQAAHSTSEQPSIWKKKVVKRHMNLKQCWFSYRMWFVYNTRVNILLKQKNCAEIFIYQTCQSLTSQQRQELLHRPQRIQMPGREDAASGNNSLWVASLACTEQHLTLHHIFSRDCNTGHRPENRASITTDSAFFRTYSCCLISLLPRFTCVLYLSLQTRLQW